MTKTAEYLYWTMIAYLVLAISVIAFMNYDVWVPATFPAVVLGAVWVLK